jgi:hypothetical protein
MAVRVVRCPNEHPVRVPEEAAGRKIKCRECGAVFVVPAAKASAPAGKGPPKKLPPKPGPRKPGPPAAKKPAGPVKRRPRDEEDEEEERPRRRRRARDEEEDDEDEETPLSAEDRRLDRLRDRRDRLKQVNLGLLLHIIKMWSSVVLIFAVILWVIFKVVITESPKTGPLKDLGDDAFKSFALMASVFEIFAMICIIATPLIGIVGSGFCLMIPRKSAANGTILASFVFDILPLVGLIMVLLASLHVFGFDDEKNERFSMLLLMGCGTLTAMALLLFMVFLRQLCNYLSKPLLGSDALNLVMFLVIQFLTFPVLMFGLSYLFKFAFGTLGVGSVGGMGVMFVASIVWFAQYYYLFFTPMMRLLNKIRETIEPKREEEDEEEEDDEDEDEKDD